MKNFKIEKRILKRKINNKALKQISLKKLNNQVEPKLSGKKNYPLYSGGQNILPFLKAAFRLLAMLSIL